LQIINQDFKIGGYVSKAQFLQSKLALKRKIKIQNKKIAQYNRMTTVVHCPFPAPHQKYSNTHKYMWSSTGLWSAEFLP
jgi:hypothetical protein